MCHRLAQVVLALLIVVFAAPTEAGSLVFWGDDSTGMAAVPAGSFKQVAISDCGSGNVHQEFGIAIRDDGTLVGWGNDSSGQTNVPSGTFIDVAAGVTCAYGVRTDGTVVGWGVNGYGGPVYMPPSNYTYKAVSCASSNFEYFLTTDGEAIGVGYGVNGVTYTGPFTAIAATDWASVGLTTSGTLVNLSSIGPTFVPPSGEFSAIAPEPYEDLAMRDDGTLVLWNASGEASGPSGTYIGIAAGLSHIVAIRSDGTLVAWGDDTYGQTNVPAGQYCYVAAGGNVSVAITVPEPSTFALLGVGAVSLFACGWWQRTKRMLATVRCRGLFWAAIATVAALGTSAHADDTHIEAVIDGSSELVIDPTGLFWVNLLAGTAKPGNYGTDYQIAGPTYIDGSPWQPQWGNSDPRAVDVSSVYPMNITEFQGLVLSSLYGGEFNAYPEYVDGSWVTLADTLQLNRNTPYLTQYNGDPAIEIDDPQNGQNVYSFDIITTPEPSALALLAAGAIVLLGYGSWRRRQKLNRKPDLSKQEESASEEDAPFTLFLPARWAKLARRAA